MNALKVISFLLKQKTFNKFHTFTFVKIIQKNEKNNITFFAF
jgi:hypothetical protein